MQTLQVKGNLVITGVSSGIGYDAVRYLTARGYRVFGSVRKESDAERLQNDFPERFVPLVFDVRDKEAVLDAAKQVGDLLNGQLLTGLVNNAGLSIAGPMALIPDDDFREQLEVNLVGVRYVTNAFLPLLGMQKDPVAKPGKIINISSMSGVFNSPFSGSYCVSKHALESLGEIYRRELMLFGIDVISIQPGPIRSEIWEKNIGTMERYKGTAYDAYAEMADQIIRDSEKRALPTETISKLIDKILNTDKPKTAYMVTRNKLLMHIAKRLPPRVLDRLIWKKLSK